MKNVKKTSRKTLIVYEDGAADLEGAARSMFREAEKAGMPVRMSSASAVKTAEVLLADFFVFGAKDSDVGAYSELKRMFRGLNLAGRKAAFFHAKGSRGVDALKSSLKDTEISLSAKDLDLGSDSADVAGWMKSAMDF